MSTLEMFEPETDMPLDAGIRRYVLVLRSGGVETFESCEGGEGHAFPEPTIRFYGDTAAGFKAFVHRLPKGETMYYLNHYVIDWDKVQTLDDVKRLLRKIDFAFESDVDISDIADFVRLEPKYPKNIHD